MSYDAVDFATVEEPAKPVSKSQWQSLLQAKMRKQMTDRFTEQNQIMCYAPKPVHIAVRKVLGIAVYAFFRYPMPNGKHETTYERIA